MAQLDRNMVFRGGTAHDQIESWKNAFLCSRKKVDILLYFVPCAEILHLTFLAPVSHISLELSLVFNLDPSQKSSTPHPEADIMEKWFIVTNIVRGMLSYLLRQDIIL